MYRISHNLEMAKLVAERSLPQVIIETSLFIFIALTGFVGNSCVLWVFYKSKDLRKKASNFYLISLAISDVMASLASTVIIATAATGQDLAGHIGGQVFGITSFTLIYGTVLTTSMVAVNRFFCVVKQDMYRKWFKPKHTITVIIVLWIISFLTVMFSYLMKSVVFRFYPGRFCYYPAFTDYTNERVTGVVSLLLTGVIPLSLIMYCYFKIKKTVQNHSKALRSSDTSSSNASNRLSSEEIHITKSLVPLVIGYVVCFMANCILIKIDIYTSLPRGLEILVTYLGCISSAINPFIYNIFNRRFRIEFAKLCSLRRSHFVMVAPRNERLTVCINNSLRQQLSVHSYMSSHASKDVYIVESVH